MTIKAGVYLAQDLLHHWFVVLVDGYGRSTWLTMRDGDMPSEGTCWYVFGPEDFPDTRQLLPITGAIKKALYEIS